MCTVIVIATSALVVSIASVVITWYYSYKQSQSAKESLSLSTFHRALDEFASENAREARRYIHQNFPDYTQEDYSSEKWHNRLKTEEKTEDRELWIREGMNQFEEKDYKNLVVRILPKDSDDKKYFEETAVRADRVGFMFLH